VPEVLALAGGLLFAIGFVVAGATRRSRVTLLTRPSPRPATMSRWRPPAGGAPAGGSGLAPRPGGGRLGAVLLSDDDSDGDGGVPRPRATGGPILISSDDETDAGASNAVADQFSALSMGASTPLPPAGDAPPPLILGPRGEFVLDGSVASMLYPHQRDGLAWLTGCTAAGRGGILADEMGLGKTMQCAAFLRGALDSGLARRALVVAPKTLLAPWAAELARVGLGAATHEYAAAAPASRAAALAALAPPHGAGVLLTTYGMLQHNPASLTAATWDVVFFDEGHKLKNAATVAARGARALPARARFLLTGTPVQNDLNELWSLLDLAAPGLLGDAKTFRAEFAGRVARGADRAASELDRAEGAGAAAALRARIAPAFLRREKAAVLGTAGAGGGRPPGAPSASASTSTSATLTPPPLGTKTDLVVWLTLTETQRELYEAFLSSAPVRACLNKTASPLAAVTVLKKICDHPGLLTEKAAAAAAAGAREESGGPSSSSGSDASGPDAAPPATPDQDPATLALEAAIMDRVAARGTDASVKTAFVAALVAALVVARHRVLLFSQSRLMLDIVEAELAARRVTMARIDGGVADRAGVVARFQAAGGPDVLLLTTGVGGLGLTLTAATRVVLIDPSWNPAADAQAVDRAYRIGQAKDVTVFRLICCGTVEEKIYRKQVFKAGLSQVGKVVGWCGRGCRRRAAAHRLPSS
jgi:SNF2 family DNA or RNA helicase